MQTLGDVKNSSAIDIAGMDPSSDQFVRLVNDATRRLLRRGDWSGSTVPIHACVKQGCVVWPSYVGAIRKINVCHVGVSIQNLWYDFLPQQGPWDRCYWWGWIGGWAKIPMVEQGRVPIYNDVLGDGRTIRAYSSTPLDNNKTITIFGEDTNGQVLRTQGVGGWTDGIVLVLNAQNYAVTPMAVRRIDRVVKQLTQGPVRLFADNGTTLEDIAVYQPSETNPSYVRSRITLTTFSGSCCAGRQSVVAAVKLAFVPVRVDTDWVLIENLDALKLMMMSIKAENASDWASKAVLEAEAFKEENYQLWDDTRDDQIPVSNGPFVGGIGRQQCY